jgi:hypothetical protein
MRSPSPRTCMRSCGMKGLDTFAIQGSHCWCGPKDDSYKRYSDAHHCNGATLTLTLHRCIRTALSLVFAPLISILTRSLP